MVDFFFVTAAVNMMWQILTVLFVLYRFTSFFSLIYNFMKFIGKILQVFVYIKNQIAIYFRKRSGYSVLTQDEINGLPTQQQQQSPKTIFTKIYEWFYNKKRPSNDRLPLYETRTSYYDNTIDDSISLSQIKQYKNDNTIDDSISLSQIKQPKNHTEFENHMHSLLQSSSYNDFRSHQQSSNYNESQDFNYNHNSTDDVYSTAKPFDVENSNMLFNSGFLGIFINKKKSVEIPTDIYERENEVEIESEYELEQSLLNSNQDNLF